MRSAGAVLLIVALAGVALWRIARPPDQEGPGSFVPAWRGARLREVPGFAILRLAGTPREKGRGHGERLKKRIRRALERARPADPGLAALAIEACGARLQMALPASYREELEGIAEGAGLSFEEVLFLNTRFDLRGHELVGTGTVGIGFSGGAAVGAGPEVLRLFERADLDDQPDELIVFVHLDRDPTVLVGLPGMAGCFLGVRGAAEGERCGASLRPIQSAIAPALTGLAWPLLLRRLLEEPPKVGSALPGLVTLDASLPFVLPGGALGTLDISPRGAAWHAATGDFVSAHPEELSGVGAVIEARTLERTRQRMRAESARRIMAGQAPARQVAVRLKAGALGVRVTIVRDGGRFAQSIRYGD